MASDFDVLIASLQYDLAVSSDLGLSFLDVQQKVQNYYAKKTPAEILQETIDNDDEELLFSEHPPGQQTIDTTQVVEAAWDWLSKLKDTEVKHDPTTSGHAHDGERLVTSKDQLWLAITGHGIDTTRLRGAEFALLHTIGKHGSTGISQPELVKETGQDKRSVPKRTQILADGGYITKVPVIHGGAKTSLLTLKRFAIAKEATDGDADPVQEGIIYYDTWFDGIVRLMKANNNIVPIEELRQELSVVQSRWHTKALQRCLRRLEASGCIRRFRPRVEGTEKGLKGAYLRCVQLLREPTESDRNTFCGKIMSSVLPGTMDKSIDADDEEEDENDGEMDDEVVVDRVKRGVASEWTPDLPISNFIYDLVERAGVAGLSIMDLHRQGVGTAWRRPMDEELIRFCDSWQVSQPPHLRHLTIVKDTASVNKYTYFVYRTFANFEQAVLDGNAFWEAVTNKSNGKGKQKQVTIEEPLLDENGFPIFDKSLFAGEKDGAASLVQCVEATNLTTASTSTKSAKDQRASLSSSFNVKILESPAPPPISSMQTTFAVESPRTKPATKQSMKQKGSTSHIASAITKSIDLPDKEVSRAATTDTAAADIINLSSNTIVASAITKDNSVEVALDHQGSLINTPLVVHTPGTDKSLKKTGISRAAGTVQVKRTHVIMDVLRKCSGLYPGNREIYYPVATALKRIHGSLVDSLTVDNSIKDLLTRGKIRKLVFHFHDVNGMQVQKSIIADPSIAPNDPRVIEMQQNIIKSFPKHYHPPHVEVSTDLRTGMEARMAGRKLGMSESWVGPAPKPKDCFPKDDSITIPRREGFLDDSTNVESPLSRRQKLQRLYAEAGSDEDEEVSEPEPDQLVRMDVFQTQDYRHDVSHAFLDRKTTRSRYSQRVSSKKFFTTPKRSSKRLGTEHTPESDRNTSTSQDQVMLDSSQAQAGADLESTPDEEVDHELVNETVPLAASYDEFFNTFNTNRTAKPVAAASTTTHKPLTRLQSLGSSLLKQGRRLPGTTRQDQIQAAAAAKRAHQGEDDRPAPKRYKSMRGNKTIERASISRESSVQVAERDAPVAGPAFALVRKRDRKGASLFAELDRLSHAVALLRVILGGMDQRNNWGLIAHMMSFRYEADFLRRRWDAVKNSREVAIRHIMEQTYEPFLQAYEDGELPTVDFDNLSQSDWPSMLNWLEEKVLKPGEMDEPTVRGLPRSLGDFEVSFSVTENATFWEYSREAWFTSPIEKSRKDLAHEFVFGSPLPGHLRPINNFLDQKLALKTWIRAVAATKSETYNPEVAAQKLQIYAEDMVLQACDEMITNKIIRHMNKGRQQPGRNYEIHDSFWGLFRRWPGKTAEWRYLRDLAKTRQSILGRLQQSDQLYLDFHASDLEIAVLTNMLDQGLIDIITELPERNDDFEAPFPKISAVGYSGYNYNAKTLDREKLRFPVLYVRSANFTVEHGLVVGVEIPLHANEKDGRIPFWVDIHGNLLPDIWDLAVRSLLHLLVFRTGCTTKLMEESYNHKFMAWEINLVMDWMERSGISLRCEHGSEVGGVWQGGWRASEWWYCAFEPEITFWKTV